KTVIEALSRLRAQGVIQDTGRRAGDNRSCIVYRLCPNAVPLVNLTSASGVNAGNVADSRQAGLDLHGVGPCNESGGESDNEPQVPKAVTALTTMGASIEDRATECAAVAASVRQQPVETDPAAAPAQRP